MATLREWVSRLWGTVRRRRDDCELEEELRLHLELAAEDARRRGHAPEGALREARIHVGSVAQTMEALRDQRDLPWLGDLVKDLRYTMRTLRRNPGFSAVAVLSLALGIGANSAIFSLVNGVMLRTLPVKEPDRLVHIGRITQEGRPGFVSYPIFELFRDNVQSVSSVFAQGAFSQSIAIDGEEDFAAVDAVSGAYFAVLRVEPAAGRLLAPSDDMLTSSPAAVITDRYWQRRFGRSPSAIGKPFTLRNRVFTIVGVTPPAFEGAQSGRASDLMLPLLTMTSDEQRRSVGFNTFNVMGRLKPGATAKQANVEVRALFNSFLQANVPPWPEERRAQFLRQRAGAVSAAGGFNPLRDNMAQPLLVLMGIVALILILACVNLSGLLLARAEARQREISIRLAMGAGRGRLVRQFLTESLALALLGGGVGLAMAAWFGPKLFELFVNGRQLALSVAPDARVLAFTAVVSLIACVAAGLAPALQALSVNVNPALKQVRTHGHRRLGMALVTAQLGISMVLIVGATLFIGSLVRLYAVDPGFDSDGVLVVNVRSSRPYPAQTAAAVQGSLLDRLRAMPGVRSASAARVLPVDGNLWDRGVQVEGYAFRPNESTSAGFNAVAPGYFATLGTPVLSGREFGDHDARTAPKVAVVNERFARYFFDDRSPLGRHVTSVGVTYEIVGVVRDTKYQNLRDAVLRTMYIPWTQLEEEEPSSYTYLARVAAGDPLSLVPGVERLIRGADSALRVRTATTYATVIDRSIGVERIMALLGGFFGVLALIIATLGMFGVLAFRVARRTNELGVRLALGASPGSMMRLVLRDVVGMLVPGVVVGAGAALMLTGLVRKILFGVTPGDPRVYIVATSVLACAAVLAGWLPARRASRVDPLVALRHE